MLLRLLRHPATASSGEQCIGQTDVALSAEGLAAIERIAEDAARTKPARILSSDLRRCRMLADAIAARLDICPERDAIWREVNFGAWENRTWDEIRSDDPHALAAWMDDFVTVAPPGGESFEQLQSRVVSALQKIDPEPFDSLLVVTHAGVIRAAVCAFSDLPLRRAFELEVSWGSTACLRWKDDHWSVVPDARHAAIEAEVRP
jgi:alpha-ribazole phosphatase